MTEIIPANSINYCNVEEVCAYRSLLCKIYECEGGFNVPAKITPTTRVIKRESIVWLREVSALIESILKGDATCVSLCEIPRLLQAYDFMHRIGYNRPCFDYLREVKLKTVDRWLKGDKSISQTDVALLLLSETDRNIRNIEDRYAKFAINVMSSWLDELTENGKFKDITLSETYKRLSYLLNHDLFAFLTRKDEAKAKAQWVNTYTMTEEQLDAADTDTLWTYAGFIDSIPFSNTEEYECNTSMYMHILTKIASRPDTHPYLAKAIELTMERRASMIA